MALTLKVGSAAQEEETPQEEAKPQVSVSMNIRKSLDGNFMIFDHPEIDIAILPETMKIVTFAKEKYSKHVYEAQDRLFTFLIKKGLVSPEKQRSSSAWFDTRGKRVQLFRGYHTRI